jgi:hypothetical protein
MLARLLRRALRATLQRSYPSAFWDDLGAACRLRGGAAGRELLLTSLFDVASERRYFQLFRDIHLGEALRGQAGLPFHNLFDKTAGDVVLGCWEARVIYSTLLQAHHERLPIERLLEDERMGGRSEDLLRPLVDERLLAGSDDPPVDGPAAWQRLAHAGSGVALEAAVASGRTVHFVLDGLDLERTPAAVAELRWVYRYWQALAREPGPILFYLGGRTTAPPWLDACALPASDWVRLRGAEVPHEGDLVEAGAAHEVLAAAGANAAERGVEGTGRVVA